MPVLDAPVTRQDWDREISAGNGTSSLSAKPVKDAGHWEPVVKKIVEFQHLSDDWDGQGAKARRASCWRPPSAWPTCLRKTGPILRNRSFRAWKVPSFWNGTIRTERIPKSKSSGHSTRKS